MLERIYAQQYYPFFVLLLMLINSSAAKGQTPEFTYQGRLTDGGNPASATYDMQFKLFDTPDVGTGTPQGQNTRLVQVTNGVFTVQLNFGQNQFNGSPRYLEIGIRPPGSPDPYTVLAPRQPITSTPYAIRSLAANGLSAACINCVTSNQIQGVQGAQVTGEIPVASIPTGSNNYIQNTTTQQAGADFNISGSGTAGIFNAATQYNLSGNRVLSIAGTRNAFAGVGAGQANTLGTDNAFFGFNAGLNNTGNLTIGGRFNSFFGASAGQMLTQGRSNSFFGASAGGSSTAGNNNSFFGVNAGSGNSGDDNAFFGTSAGQSNSASGNAFFGTSAGLANTTGHENAFFGRSAGQANTLGFFNSFFGYQAGISSTGERNSFFGTLTGFSNTTGTSNSFFGSLAGFSNTMGSHNTTIGENANVGSDNLDHATAIGADAIVTASNRIQLGRNGDTVAIGGLGVPTSSMHVCIDSNIGVFVLCASSLRYKENVQPFFQGLPVIKQLRPVTFNWKEGHEADLGLIAEEVNAVEPLLNSYYNKGEIEGVKYEQLTVVLINAVKEQQAQIEQQQQQLRQQRTLINGLRKLVCQNNPHAEVCKRSATK